MPARVRWRPGQPARCRWCRRYHPPRGRLAQLVERLPYKQEVTGSSPVPPIAESPGAIAFLATGDRPRRRRTAAWKHLGSHCGLNERRPLAAPQGARHGHVHALWWVSSRKEKMNEWAITLRLPVVQARSGDGLDGRRRVGLYPAEGDAGTANAPREPRLASLSTQPDGGREPLSENASQLPSGEERRVDTCHKLGGAPCRAVSTASRARFHVAVRLPATGSAANTTARGLAPDRRSPSRARVAATTGAVASTGAFA